MKVHERIVIETDREIKKMANQIKYITGRSIIRAFMKPLIHPESLQKTNIVNLPYGAIQRDLLVKHVDG